MEKQVWGGWPLHLNESEQVNRLGRHIVLHCGLCLGTTPRHLSPRHKIQGGRLSVALKYTALCAL